MNKIIKTPFIIFIFLAISQLTSHAKSDEYYIKFFSENIASINGKKKKFKNPELLITTSEIGKYDHVMFNTDFNKDLFPIIDKLISFLKTEGVRNVSYYTEDDSIHTQPKIILAPIAKIKESTDFSNSKSVKLSIVMNKNGRISDIQLLKSQDKTADNLGALSASNWRGLPAIQNGKSIVSQMEIDLEFDTLDKGKISNIQLKHLGNILPNILSKDETVDFIGYCQYAIGEKDSKHLSFRNGSVFCSQDRIVILKGDFQNPLTQNYYEISYEKVESAGYASRMALSQIQVLDDQNLYAINILNGKSVDKKANKKLLKMLHNHGLKPFKPKKLYQHEKTFYEPINNTQSAKFYGSKIDGGNVLMADFITYIAAVEDKLVKNGDKKWDEPLPIAAGTQQLTSIMDYGTAYSLTSFHIDINPDMEIAAKSEKIKKSNLIKMWLEDITTGEPITPIKITNLIRKDQIFIPILL